MKKMPLQQTHSPPSLVARQIGAGLLLIVACWLAPCSSIFAACALSSQTLTFGSINPQSIATIYTSGTANVSCTGLQRNAIISVCLAIGAGDAPGSNKASRLISAGGSNRIPIVIKSSPSSPQEIGTGNPYPQAGPITFLTNVNGSGSANFPLTIALSGPISVAPGIFSNIFSGKEFKATYQVNTQTQCSNVTSNAIDGQLIVLAAVVAGCTVTATAMNFGAISVLTRELSATSTITLNCTQGVTATIGLDNGQTGTGPGARKLRSGNSSISYGIYRDSSHILPWGQTAGSDTVTVPMLQSTSVSVMAFGIVPSQGTPTSGSYIDVVRVTITY